jgi:hypothetical protein
MPVDRSVTVASPQAKNKLQAALASEETFATSLMAIVLSNYGTEAFEWDAEALLLQLRDDFNARLPKLNVDKLMSLMVAMTTNQFQLSWEVFSQTCSALNGDEANFSDFYPIDAEDIAWGVTEVWLNDPPAVENGTSEFSHEVARYAGVIMANNAIWRLPDFLRWIELPEENPAVALDTAFDEDPAMFSAVYTMQQANADYLKDYVTEKTKALKQELKQLPIASSPSPT